MKNSINNLTYELVKEAATSEQVDNTIDTECTVKLGTKAVGDGRDIPKSQVETLEIYINKGNISKIVKKGIVYIKPLYIDNYGLSTEILTQNERYITRSRVESIIDLILYEFMLNRAALKEKTSKILNQRNIIPYCVNSDLILVPFKMIEPIGKESCVGYINYRYISGTGDFKKFNCTKDRNQSVVLIGNYGQVKVLASRKTCLKHFRECFLAAVHIFRRVDIELICE